MFATLRKNQKWLLAFITAATIVTFLIFFMPNFQYGSIGRGGGGSLGTINGEPVGQKEYRNAYAEVLIEGYLELSHWPGGQDKQAGFDIDRRTAQRVFLDRELQKYDIHVGDATVARWIKDSPLFQDRNSGQFQRQRYDFFVGRILREKGLGQNDFKRFVQHQLGIQHLEVLMGANGLLIAPQQGEDVFRAAHQKAMTQAVLFSYTNYLAQVRADPASIARFYTNRMAEYRLPRRIQVNYVAFPLTNYLAAADADIAKQTNFDAKVESIYLQEGTNSFTDSSGKPLPPDQAKKQLRQEFRRQFALSEAKKTALSFAQDLFQLKPLRLDNLDRLARSKGYVAHLSAPFAASEGPTNLEVSENFAHTAFQLSKDQPFSIPLVESNAVYVIGLDKVIPSTIPPLSTIRQKVVQDFRNYQATQMARTAGEHFYQSLTNALNQGQSFEQVCAKTRVRPVSLPGFSQSTSYLPEAGFSGELSLLKQLAFNLDPGKVSPFTPTEDGGLVLHLVKFKPVDEDTLKAELPQFLAQYRRSRMVRAFEAWFQQAYKAANPSFKVGETAAD